MWGEFEAFGTGRTLVGDRCSWYCHSLAMTGSVLPTLGEVSKSGERGFPFMGTGLLSLCPLCEVRSEVVMMTSTHLSEEDSGH